MKRISELILIFGLMVAFRQEPQKAMAISSLKLINEIVVPHHYKFNSTTVGGLSGIDYDPAEQVYYVISDDRSSINPARYYKIKIPFSSHGMDSIQWLESITLLQANGKAYPDSKVQAELTPDAEAIRYYPPKRQVIWTNEGERIVRSNIHILNHPSISISDQNGRLISNLPIPPIMEMKATESGPRQNATLEGIAFNQDYSILYAAMEEPLYEDGSRAELKETKSWVRITQYNFNQKKFEKQFAYPLEPVAFPASSEKGMMMNGLSEILVVDPETLLVVERSFSSGRFGCTIRIFLADIRGAENVLSTISLKNNDQVQSLKKKLLLNMDDLGIYIDNIEGVTWGPELPNGHKSLLFVADDNFLFLQKTQFLLFDVIPGN